MQAAWVTHLPLSSLEAAAYRMGLAPRSVGWPAMALDIATDAPMGSDLSVLAYSGAFVMPEHTHTPIFTLQLL